MGFWDSLSGIGDGVSDWLTQPLDTPDPGFNRLGVLGAALQDFGAAQQGGQGNALANFAQQQRRAAQYPRADAADGGADGLLGWFTRPLEPSAGFNRLGVLGAALQDIGAAQQGRQGSALANFAQQQRQVAQYPNPMGSYGRAGGYAYRPAMRYGSYWISPPARLQTIPNVSVRPGFPEQTLI